MANLIFPELPEMPRNGNAGFPELPAPPIRGRGTGTGSGRIKNPEGMNHD